MQIAEIIRGDLALIEAIAPEKLAKYEKEKAYYEKRKPAYTPEQWTEIDKGPYHVNRGDGWLIARNGDVYTCNYLTHNNAAYKLFGVGGATAQRKLGVVFALIWGEEVTRAPAPGEQPENGAFLYSNFKILTPEQLAAIKKLARGLPLERFTWSAGDW
jgi:hypothetical protein